MQESHRFTAGDAKTAGYADLAYPSSHHASDKSRALPFDETRSIVSLLSGTSEDPMTEAITIFLALAAGWSAVTAEECTPIELFQEGDWVVADYDCEPIEGDIERPSVQLVLTPTPIEFGPMPAYSPLHAIQ